MEKSSNSGETGAQGKYSIDFSKGKIRFFKSGEKYWELSGSIEPCKDGTNVLWSNDGSRLAFHCLLVDYLEKGQNYLQWEKYETPFTIVANLENCRFLWVYEGDIDPMQWNENQDDLVISADAASFKRFEGYKWQWEYYCINDSEKEASRKESCQKEASQKGEKQQNETIPNDIKFISLEERARRAEEPQRLAMWRKVAPEIDDTDALEEELGKIDLPFLEAGSRKPCDEALFRMAVKQYKSKQQDDFELNHEVKTSCTKDITAVKQSDNNTPVSELAKRWKASPNGKKMARQSSMRFRKSRFPSNNLILLFSALAISTLWIWGNIALYREGYHEMAKTGGYIGSGVLVAILSRLLVHYELRFERKFLMWRLIAIFVASFSSLSYQIARGVNALIKLCAGMQPDYSIIFWAETIPLGILLILGAVMSHREANDAKAKRWSWLSTISLILIIGATVFTANSR